jgi:hypothetical protein
VETLNRMTIEWFEKWLGKPELDLTHIQRREPKQETSSGKKIAFSYRLTFELPGEITHGRCRGRFLVKAGDKILHRGNIQMDNLPSKDKQTFFQKFDVEEADVSGKEIMWNFQGEISISLFDKPHEIMYMQGEKYNSDIEGVGYHFRIKQNKTVEIVKKVYRKNTNEKLQSLQPAIMKDGIGMFLVLRQQDRCSRL